MNNNWVSLFTRMYFGTEDNANQGDWYGMMDGWQAWQAWLPNKTFQQCK